MPRTAEEEIRVLAPTGVCGSGFLESTFERAMSFGPHFIGVDSGSTDPGPAYLGGGRAAFPRDAVKRDLRIMIKGARQAGIPLLIGSAGTAGGDRQLAWMAEIVTEIAAEEKLGFRLALIHAEQRKEAVKQWLRQGRIKPLKPAPHYDEAVVDQSSCIVGMMGAEPFQDALAKGAEVVLAGRASDTAIFAAIPTSRGIPGGIAWHAAKILECGAAAAVNRAHPDCMFAWLRKDHFVVNTPNPEMRCTPQSIAAHALYENADPFRLTESAGVLDISASTYESMPDGAVKVAGSRFEPAAQYSVKLEGAELVGYQSVLFGSIRDPYIIGQLDDWLARLKTKIVGRVHDVLGDRLGPGGYILNIRVYGRDGTMGPLEPIKTPAHEVCLVFEITAATQDIANAIAGMTRHQALHLPIPEWSGLITAVACPYNYLERGKVYRFNVNHVVMPADPREMFPIEVHHVGPTH